ncbi:MAG: VWA domain-containing protein [Clostridia bacterium]|nr:VWA domain-containing protein [Clostridia bacterium]
MKWNARLKLVSAMLLALILLLQIAPMGAENASPALYIHYVDTNGNELPVVNGRDWTTDTTTTPAFLIYDIEGYDYVKTTLKTIDGTDIRPILRLNQRKWQYTTSTGSGVDWYNIPADSAEPGRPEDIYVVYKEAEEPVMGGTPKVKEVEGAEKPAEPTITKGSVINGDGTNTLSLSVTGHTAEMEVEKLADVIVIYDTSSSMRRHMGTSTTTYENNDTPVKNYKDKKTRMWIAAEAVNNLANTLIGSDTEFHDSTGKKLIRMSLISFNANAEIKCGFTEDYATFKNAVDNLTTNTGTNWEAALDLANYLAVDPERATFVIFVTDGNPSYRVTRGNLLELDGYPATVDDEHVDVYSSNTYAYYRGTNHFGGLNENDPRNYNTAAVTAQSIVSHNKNFYSIGIGNSAGITRLQGLTAAAYGGNETTGADHTKTADNPAELAQAFEEITASIVALMGHSDIQIMDGIADLTQTVQKSSLVSFAEDDFTYYKGHEATAQDVANGLASAEGEMVWVSWDPASEGCAEAVYNEETGAVEWNMGPGFMLEEGYTYQVRFKVWPSQEAYDLLADLNNGVKSYDSLTDEEKAQIQEPTTEGGMYTLKTNGETSYTYREATKTGDTVTPTGEPSEPGSFPDVDPLELTTKPLKVMKQWHNNYVDSRIPTNSITLELYGVDSDGVTSHSFKEFQLTRDGGWYAENNYISYGLVTYDTATNAGEKIYEAGHDFTLRETDDEAHYYELTAGVYRPMFINGTPTILEQVDSAPAGMSDAVFHYFDGSHHYYRLDGKIYRDTQTDILMIATNTHRSYMDLKKAVVDASGNSVLNDEEFEYHITFTVPEDIDNYDTVEKYVWFSVYDTVAGRTLAPGEYSWTNALTPDQIGSEFSGPDYANYLVAISGQQLTLKIKQGWNVRFLNLPIGTTYSFEETGIPMGYDFVKAEVTGTQWIANMVDGTDQGYPQTIPPSSLPSNTSGSNDDTDIGGTIELANARYSTTYTNKTSPKAVKVLKTKQDGAAAPLPNAVFSLYTQSGYAADPKQAAMTGLTSDENGMFDLGLLACGTYYLEETAVPYGYNRLSGPVIIHVTEGGVTCVSPYSTSGNAEDGYVITVPNTPLTATLPLRVVKILEGRDMKAEEFSFVLQPIKTDGTLVDPPLQIIHNPDGPVNQEVTISFDPVEFSGDKLADAPYHDTNGNAVYYYVVYEKNEDAGGMTYSDSQYIVKVTLVQQENKLFASPQFYPYSGEGPLPTEATINVTTN